MLPQPGLLQGLMRLKNLLHNLRRTFTVARGVLATQVKKYVVA